jgi:2-aminoadipate transaminase
MHACHACARIMLQLRTMTVDQACHSDLLAARAKGGVGGELVEILALAAVPGIVSFAGGFPDPATFPISVLAALVAELVEGEDTSAFQYAPIEGLPSVLDLLADRLEQFEASRPARGELLVTSGGIDGLGLISKSFLERGDVVAVEGPTYLGALMAFRGFEADVVAVPMEGEDGLDVDALDRVAAERRPKLLYTIPDYQNPTGVSLTLERRTALVEAARRHGFLVVEDVAYRELGFDETRLPSLWTLAPDVVVQLGTFSKTFCPGVRLGWAVGPRDVIKHLTLAKQNADQCAGALGQRLLEIYARRGLLDEQNMRARELYGRRCRATLEALDTTMPEDVGWTSPRGGFFTWLTLPPHLDAQELARSALAEGIAYVPGAPFFPDGRGSNNLRLSFSNIDFDSIPVGIERLATLFRKAVDA